MYLFSLQLYHSKLEQLQTLTNRINTISRTLGSDFYSRDITEAAPAPGLGPGDPNPFRDVTVERLSKLEKELVRGKAEIVSLCCLWLSFSLTHYRVAHRTNG